MATIIPASGLAIRNYADYYVNAGAVLTLLYLTPEPNVCSNDERAFGLLTAPRGIAAGTQVTAAGTNAPKNHGRVSDRVWQACVVLTEDGVIGDIVPKSLAPCPGTGTKGLYQLSAVTLWADSAGWARQLAVDLQDRGEETLLDPKTGQRSGVIDTGSKILTGSTPAEMADAAKDAASAAGAKAADATRGLVWDVAVPLLLVAGVLYLIAKRIA